MANGTPYVQETLSTIDVGKTYQKQSKTWQAVDSYGNVTEQRQFEYGLLTTPARTYQYTYLNAADYVNRYIRNRMTGATLTAGGVTKTLRTMTYDVYTGTSCAGGGPPTYYTNAMADAAGIRHHDSTYNTAFTYRGNAYQVSQFGEATGCANYDTAGNVVRSNSLGGPTFVGTSYTTATNFAAPTAMNPNNTTELTTTLQYNSFLGVVQQNSPNSVVSTFSFDSIGRPSTVTMPDGQTKSFTYSLSAPHIYWWTSSARGYTYLDGLGRTIKEERLGQVVLSTVDTEYDACACSPVGKLKRVSMPYAPGQTPVWTTYSYDALGRTTQVTQPGSSGTTTYVYQGNTVKVTGPTGKWKKYTLDAFGNLVQVNESDGSAAGVPTVYTYNQFNQLTQVQMTRGSTTQTRSFAYDAQQRLQSETHPETGTTTYGYFAGRLAQKTDARNQTVGWGFDSYGRLASVGWGSTTFVSLSYDTPVDPSQTNVWGRLSLISYGDLREYYSYDTRGRVTKKALYTGPGSSIPAFNQALEYQYNSIGDMTGVKYPGWSGFATVAYGDDRRPDGMTQPGGNNFARYAEYDYLGRMSSLQMLETAAGSTYATQTWTYNGLGQMTRQTITGQVDIEYRFSTTQNDGRITHRKDWISGEEVAYLYDTLGRMTSAVTTGPEWGQSFVFDGFGNLTQQVVTKGSAPAMSMTVDATKNRLTGTGITYDAAGNLLSDSVRSYWYDVFGRLSGTAGESYVYDPRNQRVLINKANGTRELNVYGIDGLLYQVWSWNGTAWSRVAAKERIYFGGRLIMVGGEKVVTDRLGSVVRKGTTNMAYYPYGQERTSTANDTAKFGTYTRDAATGLDYAMNRYYQSSWGRFTTADPYRASGGPADPGSWNRYAYVGGDPVNYFDPVGLLRDPCADDDMQDDPYCVYKRGGSGRWGIGVGSYWNGEYWSNFYASVWIPGVPPGRGSSGVPPPKPECDTRNEGNARIIGFLRGNRAAAATLSEETGLDATFILAWSAAEVGWGLGSAAVKNNNYFGLTTNNWPGSIACGEGAFAGFACFAVSNDGRSLLASGRSALSSANGRYLTPALNAQNNKGSAADIARAIANAGFNSEFGDEGVTYGKRIQGTFDSVMKRIGCLD